MSTEFVVSLPTLDITGFHREARKAMSSWGQGYIRDLVTDRMNGAGNGRGLNRRTGNMARGWNAAVSELPEGAELRVWISGPAERYAALQEFGGTVRPKTAKNLWIPLSANLTPAGVQRITPREAWARGGFINKGVFFGVAGSGRKRTAGFDITPLFALKKSVYVPARMGARTHFASKVPSLAQAVLNASQWSFNDA